MGKLHELHVPMTCLVGTHTRQFSACSLLPLTTRSLCYGSSTAGVHIARTETRAAELADTLAGQINIRRHLVRELGTGRVVDTALPYGVQIHRWGTADGACSYFLHMCHRLWARYTSEVWLRPEAMVSYNVGEIEAGYEKFTWRDPAKCSECGKYINDYEYYVYEKYAFGEQKLLMFQYACCLVCYARLLPSRGFKVPYSRLARKAVPPAERLIHWKNESTGAVVYKMPFKRVPLNPDVFDGLSEADPGHAKDKETLSKIFSGLRNTSVESLVGELNSAQDYMLTDAEHLASLAHSRGINLRFLGRVVFQASCEYVRQIAVAMLLSRGIKRMLQAELARLELSDDPRDLIVSYLNSVLSVADTETGKVLWDQLTDYIRQHWDVSIERTVLAKLHLPSLAIATCRQLRITFAGLLDANYLSPMPFSKLELSLLPGASENPYAAYSVDLLLTRARVLDARGTRSQWNSPGGPERAQATECYDRAIRAASTIYHKESVQYAEVALEFARHLEGLHEEAGNPLNSKWNRSAHVPSSPNSDLAMFFFSDALKVFEVHPVLMYYKQTVECLIGLSRLVANTDVRIDFADGGVGREERRIPAESGRDLRTMSGRGTHMDLLDLFVRGAHVRGAGRQRKFHFALSYRSWRVHG